MGWANCGDDSKGRPIGYAHSATCDHPGCDAEIHRGLAYSCGGMHGETELSCEGYFCERHRGNVIDDPNEDRSVAICDECYAEWEAGSAAYWTRESAPPSPDAEGVTIAPETDDNG